MITASQNNLIQELFVRTADENYITARWCAINRLDTDFLWLSVHALEKYLKAVLLANGNSAIKIPDSESKFGHDIVLLYSEVKKFSEDLLPKILLQPRSLDIHQWFERTPEQFMEHLLRNGNADNRYLIYGFTTFSQDLHMLDTMVFAIRRMICKLDGLFFVSKIGNIPTFTNRDLLEKDARYYGKMHMPLDDLINTKEETPKRMAALNLNMEFVLDGYVHEPVRAGSSARNPVILRRILDPLNSGDFQIATEGIQIANWFIENVQLPKDVRNEIKDTIKLAMKRHEI